MRVLGVDASPSGGGRTATAIERVLHGAAAGGADTRLRSLAAEGARQTVLGELDDADAFVFGAPVYRAAPAAPLKALLDEIPRAEDAAPIAGRAVSIVLTGAGWYHYLALDPLRSILAGFFAAHVLPPGLFVPGDGFDERRVLLPELAEAAEQQGRALVELARCLEASPALSSLRPQA